MACLLASDSFYIVMLDCRHGYQMTALFGALILYPSLIIPAVSVLFSTVLPLAPTCNHQLLEYMCFVVVLVLYLLVALTYYHVPFNRVTT